MNYPTKVMRASDITHYIRCSKCVNKFATKTPADKICPACKEKAQAQADAESGKFCCPSPCQPCRDAAAEEGQSETV